jgi:hypothetical protein
MEDVDDWPTLCKVLFNPYLLGEARLHDDVDVKEALNRVLWKIVRTPTAYDLALKDFVESWSPFSNTHTPPPPNERPKLAPTWMVGFD